MQPLGPSATQSNRPGCGSFHTQPATLSRLPALPAFSEPLCNKQVYLQPLGEAMGEAGSTRPEDPQQPCSRPSLWKLGSSDPELPLWPTRSAWDSHAPKETNFSKGAKPNETLTLEVAAGGGGV